MHSAYARKWRFWISVTNPKSTKQRNVKSSQVSYKYESLAGDNLNMSVFDNKVKDK